MTVSAAEHATEAEQGVLGAVLLDNGAFAGVADVLTPGDFFAGEHRLIFSAIGALLREGTPADAITVFERLRSLGTADDCGGLAYLNELAQCVPSARNARVHAGIVRDRSRLRALAAAADEARTAALDPKGGDAASIAATLIERAADIAADPERGRWALPGTITPDEMHAARLSPRCIVENYLYADVGTLIAPGSTGKTTATLYEAVQIGLERPLWGLKVVTPGPVLIVTAEDRREYLVARLREICAALRLSPAETARVRDMVRIDDRTTSIRKLTAIVSDVVTGSGFAEEIVSGCKGFAPVLVQFDPMVSFGVGESRVNDAEQALIEAGRVICGGLDCATRYVHHSGKGSALDKRTDQYAGRGGSALPDGCRMVAVMASVDDAELHKATGERLGDGESAFRIERPKVSYAPPQRAAIYIRRRGYAFERLRVLDAVSSEDRAKAIGEQLARFIVAELQADRRYTRNTLEQLRPENLSRPEVRLGMAWLAAHGRLHDRDVIGADGKKPATGARTYLDADGEPKARR